MKWSEFAAQAPGLAAPSSKGFADTQEAAIQWRPPESVPLFAVQLESTAYISSGRMPELMRWRADRGMEQVPHPED